MTIFGRRRLEIQTNDDSWLEPISQNPGDFYIGNMCAAWHRVGHFKNTEAEPLFREKAADPGIHITVMVRTDVFGAARARGSSGTPCPVDVYHVVNGLVAQRLARRPWRMPTLAECIQCMPGLHRKLGAPEAAASAALGAQAASDS